MLSLRRGQLDQPPPGSCGPPRPLYASTATAASHVQAGQTVGPENERDRASVVRLVLNEMPHHPPARREAVGGT